MSSLHPPPCQCGNVLSQVHSDSEIGKMSIFTVFQKLFAQPAETRGSSSVVGCESQSFIAQLPVNLAGGLHSLSRLATELF